MVYCTFCATFGWSRPPCSNIPGHRSDLGMFFCQGVFAVAWWIVVAVCGCDAELCHGLGATEDQPRCLVRLNLSVRGCECGCQCSNCALSRLRLRLNRSGCVLPGPLLPSAACWVLFLVWSEGPTLCSLHVQVHRHDDSRVRKRHVFITWQKITCLGDRRGASNECTSQSFGFVRNPCEFEN